MSIVGLQMSPSNYVNSCRCRPLIQKNDKKKIPAVSEPLEASVTWVFPEFFCLNKRLKQNKTKVAQTKQNKTNVAQTKQNKTKMFCFDLFCFVWAFCLNKKFVCAPLGGAAESVINRIQHSRHIHR